MEIEPSDVIMDHDMTLGRPHQIVPKGSILRVNFPAQSFLPPCKICGGKASGIHFGAITCEACKVKIAKPTNVFI